MGGRIFERFLKKASLLSTLSSITMRQLFESLGIKDIVAKSLGSSNPINVLRACIKGLKSQNSPKLIAKRRGQNISEITKKKQ